MLNLRWFYPWNLRTRLDSLSGRIETVILHAVYLLTILIISLWSQRRVLIEKFRSVKILSGSSGAASTNFSIRSLLLRITTVPVLVFVGNCYSATFLGS